MAMKPGLLTDWPWQKLGSFKYVVYVPLAATAVHASLRGDAPQTNYSLILLALSLLRYVHGQVWMTVTRLHDLVKKHRVQRKSIPFEQLDRESTWEDYILLQALLVYAALLSGLFAVPPVWNTAGFIVSVFWHAGPVEFVYYWFHRLLHHHYLYQRYHSHHHLSFQTQALTGNVHPFAEHLSYAAIFGSTILFNYFCGTMSVSLFLAYALWFDFMNNVGHCNWEFIPEWLYMVFPPLKYLLYSASFHSLHHTQVHTNFCLFMPIYDYLYGTVDKLSDDVYTKARQDRTETVDAVYLTHPTDLLSIFHFSFGIPSFAARPYSRPWYIRLLYPLAVPVMLLLWSLERHIPVEEHVIDERTVQVWAVPRYNFHFRKPSQQPMINRIIEKAILSAQRKGAKVICLGLHTKDEQLNASGALFVKSGSDLRIKIVDGSTLTAAVVINKIPSHATEVFCVGAESKVGQAIVSYLCAHRSVTVKVMTSSTYGSETILKSVPPEFHHRLIRVDALSDGKDSKVWIVGRALSAAEQLHAPPGTWFCPLTEEEMERARDDCSYSNVPAMRVPLRLKGLRGCEGGLARGVVRASHAGCVQALLHGWERHEVGGGSVEAERIETVFQAALELGFQVSA